MQKNIYFKSDNSKTSKKPFTLPEPTEAIQRSHKSTVNPNKNIHEFLKQ